MATLTRIHKFLRQNVLGLVAIFIALGGTALALPGENTVNSGDIKNGAVDTPDLHGDAVTAGKIDEENWHAVQANPAAASDPCAGTPETGVFCGSISESLDTVLWRNYNGGYETARFYRDAVGQVHIQGLVQQLTAGNATAQDEPTVFYLPAGYRPAARLIFSVDCSAVNGVTHGRIDVLTNGAVTWTGDDNCVPGYYMSLTGISFRAEV
jgi:hypothetical protein